MTKVVDNSQGQSRLRFHWRLPLGRDETSAETVSTSPGRSPLALPDIGTQLTFCRIAEQYGIDSLLTAFAYYMPDPIVNIAALSMHTEKIQFILAYRPGLMSPTVFVQQVNTLSALSGGRLSLNVVMGHSQDEQRSYGDLLAYPERYQRADDFLAICRAFWNGAGEVNFSSDYYQIARGRLATPFVSGHRTAPEIFIAGGSEPSRRLAARHADCWLRMGTTPEAMKADADAMRNQGVRVGVRMSLIVRATREEAVQAAYALVSPRENDSWVPSYFHKSTDSTSISTAYASGLVDAERWPTAWLWTGAVDTFGPTGICLVGSPDEVAYAIGEYRRVGVSDFIFSGWPHTETLRWFGEEVVPLVRDEEQAAGERGQPMVPDQPADPHTGSATGVSDGGP